MPSPRATKNDDDGGDDDDDGDDGRDAGAPRPGNGIGCKLRRGAGGVRAAPGGQSPSGRGAERRRQRLVARRPAVLGEETRKATTAATTATTTTATAATATAMTMTTWRSQ